MNNIDKYGFSELLYSEYWQKDYSKGDKLRKFGADNGEALKKYFDLPSSRQEIIDVYKRFTIIDFKDYLDTGYSHYLDGNYEINFEKVTDEDLWKYIETNKTNEDVLKSISKQISFDFIQFVEKGYFNYIDSKYVFNLENIDSSILELYIERSPNLDLGILKEISQKIKFTKQQKEKISIHYQLLEFPINYSIFTVNKVVSVIKDEIKELDKEFGEYTIEQLKDKGNPVTYWERDGDIDNAFRDAGLVSKNKVEELNHLLLKIEETIPNQNELELAIKSNDIHMIQKLLERGVKVSPKIFTLAIEHNCTDAVQYFLTNVYLDIDVNKMDHDYDCCDSNLQKAIDNDNSTIVKLLIENEVDVNYENDQGENALFNACRINNLNIIKLLIEEGIKIKSGHLYHENNTSFEKFTYLLTLSSKSPVIIDFLLSKKDLIVNDLRLLQEFYDDHKINGNEYSLFEYAIKKDALLIVKLLIEFENKKESQDLLLLSAKYNSTEIFKYLYSLNEFEITDEALSYACSNENDELIEFLLVHIEYYDILICLLLKNYTGHALIDFFYQQAIDSKTIILNLLISNLLNDDQLNTLSNSIENLLNILYSSEIVQMEGVYLEGMNEIYIEHHGHPYSGETPKYDYRNCYLENESLIDVLLFLVLLKEVNSSNGKTWLEIKKTISFYNKVSYSPFVKTYELNTNSKLLFSESEFINLIMNTKNLKLTDYLLKNKDSLIDDSIEEIEF